MSVFRRKERGRGGGERERDCIDNQEVTGVKNSWWWGGDLFKTIAANEVDAERDRATPDTPWSTCVCIKYRVRSPRGVSIDKVPWRQ